VWNISQEKSIQLIAKVGGILDISKLAFSNLDLSEGTKLVTSTMSLIADDSINLPDSPELAFMKKRVRMLRKDIITLEANSIATIYSQSLPLIKINLSKMLDSLKGTFMGKSIAVIGF